MPISLSQGQTVTFGGAPVGNVTQASVSESAPLVDVSSLALADGSYREFVSGLSEPAEISITTIGEMVGAIGANGEVQVGNISFTAATVMSVEEAYRVGEVIAYTTTIRAF